VSAQRDLLSVIPNEMQALPEAAKEVSRKRYYVGCVI
jgi:hypothetical protein